MKSTRELSVQAIQNAMLRHGVDLHWETLAEMLTHQQPELFQSYKDVVRTLALHPEHFIPLGEGAYSLRRVPTTRTSPQSTFTWPSKGGAFFLGSLCARGVVDPDYDLIRIGFRYGGRAYSHKGRAGYIGKGSVSVRASDVVPIVPRTVAKRIGTVVSPAVPEVHHDGPMQFHIKVDCHPNHAFVMHVLETLQAGLDYESFMIPPDLMSADRTLKKSFLQGFAQVCGLASAGTNLYGLREQVWLRPDTDNKPLFHQVIELLRSLGLGVYWNDRDERDIAIKINCEDWLQIRFGVKWLDQIVAEGARLNAKKTPRRGRQAGIFS